MAKKCAFIFPGQGSQSQGMLAEVAEQHSIIQETFAEASDVLGYDIWALAQDGPIERLNTTEFTQPALLVAGVALWRLWQLQDGSMPLMMAGHSLGEYTALVCAGSLNFSDAVSLVAERGQFMQQAVAQGEGAMAAIIGMDVVAVNGLCEEAAQGDVLAPANFNALGQVVVAGHKTAVDRAVAMAKAKGAKLAKVLPVSVPSHCHLMAPAAKQLAGRFADIKLQPPTVPVVNNVDVATAESETAIVDALVRQLSNPVRWVEVIQRMVAEGVEQMVECGPGAVLTGLNKRIDRSIQTFSLASESALQAALA